eukprot:m51a1_g12859 hypothetical protein (253) ;mRNA; r:1262-2465
MTLSARLDISLQARLWFNMDLPTELQATTTDALTERCRLLNDQWPPKPGTAWLCAVRELATLVEHAFYLDKTGAHRGDRGVTVTGEEWAHIATACCLDTSVFSLAAQHWKSHSHQEFTHWARDLEHRVAEARGSSRIVASDADLCASFTAEHVHVLRAWLKGYSPDLGEAAFRCLAAHIMDAEDIDSLDLLVRKPGDPLEGTAMADVIEAFHIFHHKVHFDPSALLAADQSSQDDEDGGVFRFDDLGLDDDN